MQVRSYRHLMCCYPYFVLMLKSVNVRTDTSSSLHFENRNNHQEGGFVVAITNFEDTTQIGSL